MNDNYSKGVIKILKYAKEEAIRLGHTYVGSEHILLGIIKDKNGNAATTLNTIGCNLNKMLNFIETSINSTNATTTTSGSLQSSGGLGIVCDAYIGGCVTATCFIGDGSQLTNVPGGGGGSGYWTCTGNNLSYATGYVCVTNTTNSTSTATGALQSTGGLGVVCDAFFGGEITVPTLCVTTCFVTAGATTTTISSGSNIELDATNRVLITDTPFRLASFTTTTRNALTAANGDLIYNTTDNKVQAYANGAWADLH